MKKNNVSNPIIQQRVERALRRDERVSSHPVDVEIRDRKICLRGTVQSSRRKLAAGEIARQQSPMPVRNELRVEMPGPCSDEDLTDAIYAALQREANQATETVAVRVRDGRATLLGTALSETAARQLEDRAMAVSGVRSVRNCLRVNLQEALRDQAMAAQARLELRQAALPADVAIVGQRAFLRPHVAGFNAESAGGILARLGLRPAVQGRC